MGSLKGNSNLISKILTVGKVFCIIGAICMLVCAPACFVLKDYTKITNKVIEIFDSKFNYSINGIVNIKVDDVTNNKEIINTSIDTNEAKNDIVKYVNKNKIVENISYVFVVALVLSAIQVAVLSYLLHLGSKFFKNISNDIIKSNDNFEIVKMISICYIIYSVIPYIQNASIGMILTGEFDLNISIMFLVYAFIIYTLGLLFKEDSKLITEVKVKEEA